jgi:hypothetical protein
MQTSLSEYLRASPQPQQPSQVVAQAALGLVDLRSAVGGELPVDPFAAVHPDSIRVVRDRVRINSLLALGGGLIAEMGAAGGQHSDGALDRGTLQLDALAVALLDAHTVHVCGGDVSVLASLGAFASSQLVPSREKHKVAIDFMSGDSDAQAEEVGNQTLELNELACAGSA